VPVSLPRALVVVTLAYLLAACNANRENAKSSVKPADHRFPAPDFTLKDADGKPVHLSDYKGNVVLLDFWATTCGPCRLEIPWFENLQRTRKDRGFEAIGVSMDEGGWEDVKPYLQRMNVNYRILMGDDTVSRNYGGVEAIPTTFLIDKRGKIAAVHIGVNSGPGNFEDSVDTLVREGEVKPPAR